MDFYFVQSLLIVLLLAAIPAVTAGYFLDLRRARIARQPSFSVLSRIEILALAMAWISGIVFCWLILLQKELHISYAIAAFVFLSLLIISKSRRGRLQIKTGSRRYVGFVTVMLLSAFVGVVFRSELTIWLSGFMLAILIAYEIWSRILGIAK
jgi:hypothetical protein